MGVKMSSNNTGGDLCECVFPYNGQNSDELTLRVGQVVKILSRQEEDAGWWKGELDGVVGFFPDNFVKVIEKKSKRPERPPPPTIQTSVSSDDAEVGKQLKKSISVEEKYDLDSLRKELEESNKARTESKSEVDQNIPTINVSNEKTNNKKEVPEVLESFGDPISNQLSHTTAGRVRPPKRRPPSQHFLKENIPEDIILEVEEEDNTTEKEKVSHQEPIKPMSPICLLDITQVKLKDSSKTSKSLDVIEQTKKVEKKMSRSVSENTNTTAKDVKTTTGPAAANIGWDKRLFDANKNVLEKKEHEGNSETEIEVASLRAMIHQIKDEMQEKLSQLKTDIEKEKEARKMLEKEVQLLRNRN